MSLTLCCVARDEALRIGHMLESVEGLVQEVRLIDNGSTDGTRALVEDWCRHHGVGCEVQYEPDNSRGAPDWLYNRCLDMLPEGSQLLLDADEVLTPEGRAALPGLLGDDFHAWELPRASVVEEHDRTIVDFDYHYRLFRHGMVRYPEDALLHSWPAPVPGARASRWPGSRPFFQQTRDAHEQLRRDKLRGQYPEKTLGEFWAEVPGWFDFQAVYEMIAREARPGDRIVEVGCYLGRSALYLGKLLQARNAELPSSEHIKLTLVDGFRILPEPGTHHDPIFRTQGRFIAETVKNLERAGLLEIVNVVQCSSHQGARLFGDASLGAVFIDGPHDYLIRDGNGEQGVSLDLPAWAPKVRPGGIFAGHDYSSLFPGVMRAVDEMFPDGVDIATSPGSWIVRRPWRSPW